MFSFTHLKKITFFTILALSSTTSQTKLPRMYIHTSGNILAGLKNPYFDGKLIIIVTPEIMENAITCNNTFPHRPLMVGANPSILFYLQNLYTINKLQSTVSNTEQNLQNDPTPFGNDNISLKSKNLLSEKDLDELDKNQHGAFDIDPKKILKNGVLGVVTALLPSTLATKPEAK